MRALGDLFRIKHGYAFKGEHFADAGESILLTPGNFHSYGGLKLKGAKEKFYVGPIPDEFVLESGDMIIAMTDLTQEAPILGAPAIIPRNSSFKFLHNQRLGKIVEINEELVAIKYLFYLFNFGGVRERIKSSATGATVKHTAPSRIYEIKAPVPSLPIQHRITAVLSAYDDLIENNTRRIKVLEEMARSLYREWFVHFRFPNHKQTKRKGDVPDGWRIVNLKSIASDIRQAASPSELDPNTPYFGLEHLPRRSIALDDWGYASEVISTKLAVRRRDILFGKIRPYLHKVGFAPLDAICSSDTIVLRPRDDRHWGLLMCAVSSDDFVSHAAQTAQGTKMPRADWKVLCNYEVALAGDAIVDRFNDFISPSADQIARLLLKNQNLRKTRDLLLPKLISGEIDVSHLPDPTSAAPPV